MLEMRVADFREVVDVDLNAPFICARAVLPGMLEKGHGKIINVCSMMSELGAEDLADPAAFLVSGASNFVHGHILYADGGIPAYIGKQPG